MKILTCLLAALSCCNAQALTCPAGMGLIPAVSPYTGQPYCMMTQEARNILGQPWNYISFADAAQKCKAAFVEGDLPTNSLWQGAASQMILQPENWTQGTVGLGTLKTDLKLGGVMFYAMGGGLWEFVQGNAPYPTYPGYIYQLQTGGPQYYINGVYGDTKFHFGPQGSYGANTSLGVTTYNASGHIMRGGDDPADSSSGETPEHGVFGAALNHDGQAASDVGFRCVCPLAYCGQSSQ